MLPPSPEPAVPVAAGSAPGRTLTRLTRASARASACILTVVSALLLIAPGVGANVFSPRGLYTVQHHVLDNGLRVVLKPRGDARNVAIRVMVGVGQNDFPCGRQEVPHFLEHLLFTGTDTHDEAALEAEVREFGGTWNAHTGREITTYEIDVFSPYAPAAVDLLHEILTRSTVSPEKVELSRDILRHESSEDDSLIRRWTYAHGIGKSGTQKMYERFGYACTGLEHPDDITREEILDAWRKYYVAGNLALVIVGDFDAATMLEKVRATFGKLATQPAPARAPRRMQVPPAADELEGTLGMLFGNTAFAIIGFVTVGYDAPDRTALQLLEMHLDAALYDTLRSREGLSYTPYAESTMGRADGMLLAVAECKTSEVRRVLALMRAEIRKLVESPPRGETLQALKRTALLASASDYETNSSIADYYVASMHELENSGRLFNEEDAVEAVTAEDLQRAARIWLDLSRAVTVVDEPTLDYRQIYLGVLGLGLMLAGVPLMRWRRRQKARAGN